MRGIGFSATWILYGPRYVIARIRSSSGLETPPFEFA